MSHLPRSRPAVLKLSVCRVKIVNSKEQGKPITDYTLESFDLADPVELDRFKNVLLHHNHTTNVFDGSRSAANNIGVVGLMLDFDTVNCTIEELQAKFSECFCVLYTTTNHSPEHPKYRVIIPFDPDKAPYFVDRVQQLYQWSKTQWPESDPTCHEAGRHYFPVCEPGRSCFQMIVNDGPYFTVPLLQVSREPLLVEQSDAAWVPFETVTPYRKRLYEKSLEWLLQRSVAKGNRNNECLLRCVEAYKIGHPIDKCRSLIHTWNATNPEPLDNKEVEICITQAYSGRYDFGNSHPSIDDARNYAAAEIEKEDEAQADSPDCLTIVAPAKLPNSDNASSTFVQAEKRLHARLSRVARAHKALDRAMQVIEAELDRRLELLYPDLSPDQRRAWYAEVRAELNRERDLARHKLSQRKNNVTIKEAETVGRWCGWPRILTLLWGLPKVGKSTFLRLNGIWHVTNFSDAVLNVYAFDTETADQMSADFYRLKNDLPDEIASRINIFDPREHGKNVTWEYVEKWAKDRPSTMDVIDTWDAMMECVLAKDERRMYHDQNTGKAVRERQFTRMKRMQPNSAIIVSAHSTKDGSVCGGSVSNLSGPDAIVKLKPFLPIRQSKSEEYDDQLTRALLDPRRVFGLDRQARAGIKVISSVVLEYAPELKDYKVVDQIPQWPSFTNAQSDARLSMEPKKIDRIEALRQFITSLLAAGPIHISAIRTASSEQRFSMRRLYPVLRSLAIEDDKGIWTLKVTGTNVEEK